MKIFYEAMDYDIVLDFDDEDPSTCTFEVTCDRMDLVTIVQDGVDINKFNIAIGALDDETILVKFAYTVTDIFTNTNTTYEYIILRVFNNVNNIRYFTKAETDNLLVPIMEYEDINILQKISNVDGIGSGLDANFLDGHIPSEEPLDSVIPISDGDGKLSDDWLYKPPIINSVSWNDNNHFQDTSYVLTIDATDPQGLDLIYEVEYNDATVVVSQRPSPNEHIFDITYGNYSNIVKTILTVTVSNSQSILSQHKEYIVVNTYPPVINSITWDNNTQYENHSYVMTIDATDPGGLDVIYNVTCNNGAVGIVQRSNPDINMFDITYGEYNQDTNVIYTIKVFNSNGIFVTEETFMTIINNGPIINSVTWDNDIHFENDVYVMTIDVQDGETTGATYEVTCNDPAVGIVQRIAPSQHMFNITYGEYTSDTNISYTITVNSALGTTIISEPMIIRNYDPKINNIAWNDNNQFENNTYIMTIDATDPLELDLTYGVTCNDGTVTIVPRVAPNEHIFDITYSEYAEDTNVEYTVIVTNTNALSDTKYQTKTIHNTVESPIINDITWDTEDQYDNNSYVMTIDAIDPNSLNLTYNVLCNDNTVGIIQRGSGDEHIFDVTYGDYIVDTDIIYSIIVTNTDSLIDTIDEPMIIQRGPAAPIINSISWDNSTQTERESYVMTIDATDPNLLDLTYGVICDDGSVNITQQLSPNEHIFDITYGEYAADANIEYTITVTNTDTLTDIETEPMVVLNIDPVINTVSWDDNNQFENESYVMTIGATDPNALDLTYEVTCDDVSVVIAQQGTTNIFDITYGAYTVDTALLYTITVTNTNLDSTIGNELITVHDANPVINTVSWDNSSHWESESYVLTIGATDPQALDLTYGVVCDDVSVNITQQLSPNEHIFDITYGAYTVDTALTYTITVTNTDTLTDIETELITVHDANPIINSITWNPTGDHDENTSYAMTIDATDPQALDLTYGVVCDDGTVGIIQQGTTNIFDITYGEYAVNTDVIFTITVTNTDTLTDVETEPITIHDIVVLGDRGIFGGGNGTSSYLNVIEYITISSGSGVTDFGDLSANKYRLAATSNGAGDRGIFAGGNDGGNTSIIEYITISIEGDVTFFNNLSSAKQLLAATSNGTGDRGIFAGGNDGGNLNVIEYITISSISGITDFGDLSGLRRELAATSNGTSDRGIFGGGNDGTINLDVIEYIIISSGSGVTDFGDLSGIKYKLAATSNGTGDRGIFAGGENGAVYLNVIEYITISSGSGVTDFGDLSDGKCSLSATSNGTNNRGIFAGGFDGSARVNVIEYITISTEGDVTDFGDLSDINSYLSATSDA